MNMKDRMHRGELYLPGDSEILEKQTLCLEKLYDFNATRPSEGEKRQKLLKEMFAEIGENCYIEPPFHANWGGAHVHFGNDVYANFNLTLVDDTHIYVGDHVMFAPASLWLPPLTRFCPSSGSGHISTTLRYTSGAIAGSVPEQSSFRVYPSVKTRWLAPEAW